jgi:dihydrofolate reductase
MRNVIVCNIVSLDGLYEGPGGDFTALNMDPAFDAYNLGLIRDAGTVVLGRTSFEMFGSFWPSVADAPANPSNPDLSAVNREFSRICNALPKAVVTDSYRPPAGHAWASTTTVVPRAEVIGWLTRERGRGAADIVVFASRTVWTGLLRDKQIDELHLVIGPDALGGGTPLFDDAAQMRLLEARRLDGSDNALLRYEVKR